MPGEVYLDNLIKGIYSNLGVHRSISAGEFYDKASQSVERGNKVILRHLGIKNPVNVNFIPDRCLYSKEKLAAGQFRPGRILLPEGLIVGNTLFVLKGKRHRVDSSLESLKLRIPIRIEVNELYKDDIRAVGAILAHEDAHLKLWLSKHYEENKEQNELCTDIAAILIGLGELIANGRNRYRGDGIVESMGYLDDESFSYVQRKAIQIQNNSEKGESEMPKIKCTNCGAENEQGDSFCGDCGTKLPSPAPAVQPVQVAVPGGAVPGQVASSATPVTTAKAKLVIKRTGRVGHEFVIDQEVMNIGRWDADSGVFPEIDLGQDDPGNHISRKHAKLFLKDGAYYIEDMGSVNGTFVNKGPRLAPGSPQKLQNGDEIIVGRTFLTFILG